MAKKVTRQDVFDNNIFTSVIKEAKEFDEVLQKIIKDQKENLSVSKQYIQTFSGGSYAELKKFNSTLEQTGTTIKTLDKLEKERINLKQKIISLQTDEGKQNEALKIQLQEQRKAIKEQQRDRLGLVSLYQKESVRLNDLRKKYKDVALAQGENSKEAKKLRNEVTQLDSKLKRVDASVGQFQRNVGNYTSAMKGFGSVLRSTLSAFGLVGGVYLFANAIKNAFGLVRDFQKENAVLAGVLGTTRENTKALTTDARRLGSITAKTASEVTQLQIAYARLGFTQSEILDLTESTIDGSIAMNSELDATANLVGAVIRTFDDLNTTDAPQVIDILTASTQRSALSFEKLETALPIVAGAANTAGIPLTKLTALLGKLSDSGIDASSSATALRNIFIESAAQGLSYEEILDKIANSTDKLTASNDEFGKRAAVSATILAKNIKATNELDEALNNVAGTAKRTAEEQLNTLDGKIQLLTSAYEGFILSLENGEGTISKVINGAIQLFTDLLTTLTSLNTTSKEFAEQKEGGITAEIKGIVAGAKDSGEAVALLNEEIQKTQQELRKTQQVLDEEKSIFDFLSPTELAKTKGLEASVETYRKKLELLRKAAEDPDSFKDPKTKTPPGTGGGGGGSDSATGIPITKQEIELLKTKEEIAKDYREEIKLTIEALQKVGAITDNSKQIEEQYQKSLKKRYEETKKAEEDASKAQQKRHEDNIAQRKEQIEYLKSVTSTTIEELNKRTEAQRESLDREISQREQNIQTQQRLAENGLANTLAFEQQAKAAAEIERDRLAEKQQRREKTLAYFNLLASYAENNPDTAAAKALTQIAIAETVSAFFAEGTEKVGDDNTLKWRNTGKDDYVVAVDKNERIISAKQNELIGNISNKELAELAYNYRTGKLTHTFINNNGEVVSELRNLNQQFSRNQGYSVDWDSHDNRVERIVKNGMTRTIRHIKSRPRI